MAVTYKDINQLTKKSTVAGTEKIPVSDTEYITPDQIADLAGGGTREIQVDISNLKSNTYISKSDGEEVTYNGWSSTYFIDISGGTQIKADRQLDYSAFYDSTEAFISSAFISTSYLAIPSNAKYVRISGSNSDMAAATVTMMTGEPFVAENVANKVTSISASSTNTQYPSAKCVYDIVGDIETLLAAL